MKSQPETPQPKKAPSFWHALGPAIIVASLVLGPGSILTSSKVGTQYGYRMIWVLLGAGFMMFCMTTLSSRLGVACKRGFCSEASIRIGKGVGAITGITVFLIASCFQFGNNLGVLAAFEAMFNTVDGKVKSLPTGSSLLLLTILNGLIVVALFGLKQIYRHLEKLMIALVMLMVAMFAINILFAGPSVVEILKGIIPSWPSGNAGRFWPVVRNGSVFSPAVVLVGMVATTCSFAGAFYQGYLVKEKGWTQSDLGKQKMDSAAGITVLVGISLIIMTTSAAVLHGKVAPGDLRTVTDVAAQLKPFLGRWGDLSVVLFSLGIFAGAFSSFLANAMVGGVLLSDGLGFDCRLGSWPTRLCTLLALLVGMGVAIGIRGFEFDVVPLIIFGQAMTVLGSPLLAGILIYLATRKDVVQSGLIPKWLLYCGCIGFILALFLAARTGWNIWLTLSLS